jgi:superfamily II DNA or RNA helicase
MGYSPPTFSTSLGASFPASSVRRGEVYFRDHHVRLGDVVAGYADAKVRGRRRAPYVVSLAVLDARATAPSVDMSCSCPHHERGELCKHLYATLLALDAAQETLGLTKRQVRNAVVASDEEPDDAFDELDIEDDAFDVFSDAPPRRHVGSRAPARAARTVRSEWDQRLSRLAIRTARAGALQGAAGALEREREAWLVLAPDSLDHDGLRLVLFERVRTATGAWGKLKRLPLNRVEAEAYPDDTARPLLSRVLALAVHAPLDEMYFYVLDPAAERRVEHVPVPPGVFDTLLRPLADSGRLVRTEHASPASVDDLVPLAIDPRGPYAFDARIEACNEGIAVRGVLARDGDLVSLASAQVALRPRLVVHDDRITELACHAPPEWQRLLGVEGDLVVPAGQIDRFVAVLAALPDCPPLPGFEATGWTQETRAPSPRVHFETPARRPGSAAQRPRAIAARLSFDYAQAAAAATTPAAGAAAVQRRSKSQPLDVRLADPSRAVVDPRTRTWVWRDVEAERRHLRAAVELGAKLITIAPRRQNANPWSPLETEAELSVPEPDFVGLALELLARGWYVEADGITWRRSTGAGLSVRSGIDWLELAARVEFAGGADVELPELLRALREDRPVVALSDGSQGVLPIEWLARMSPFAQLGVETDGALRFVPGQAAILDALLAAREASGDAVSVDAKFLKLRDRLRAAARIAPRAAPKSFRGELRTYQREGLGWLHQMQTLGLGACLADDMGLGKTVQILALLASRATRGSAKGRARKPSIVVAPSSVLSHWIREAATFCPRLRVCEHRGPARHGQLDALSEHDLVVMSYAVLRLDIASLAEIDFDYVILDEAQAIKNPSSKLARCARLLRGEHRLALTGTPVENHLGDLFSIFEFLNAGLLGRSRAVQTLARSSGEGDAEAVEALARGLRPLIFRRTKEQVLADLPPKTEQTLICDLSASERRHYEQLRRYFRRELLGKVERDGVERSRIVILEALLRLRQAACHVGLVDSTQIDHASAKLDLLSEQLEQVLDEGHKALVFSQFTSLLAIVRDRLESRSTRYAYLDGSTRDREKQIDMFQNDPGCALFLISLKAGGVGLNLTAADYVYLLDPWWNPAVESQAIDRAHRIGQQRPVFGYRLISRDTVEERVLELQERKRELADAFLGQSRGSLATLSLADLDALLS